MKRLILLLVLITLPLQLVMADTELFTPQLGDSESYTYTVLDEEQAFFLLGNSAPTINITSPANATTQNYPFYINWTAVDPDGHALTVSVEIRSLAGITLKTLVSGMNSTNNSYLVNDSTIAGTTYDLYVVANETSTSQLYGAAESIQVTIPPATTSGVVGGGGGGGGADYSGSLIDAYDVKVNVERSLYARGSEVTAKITLINNWDVPDRDTILVYYLLTPQGEQIMFHKEQFMEIPPGKKHIEREITIPINAALGEYSFYVEYYTAIQDLIVVHDAFEVAEESDILRGLIINNVTVALIILFLFIRYTKNHDEKRRKKYYH